MATLDSLWILSLAIVFESELPEVRDRLAAIDALLNEPAIRARHRTAGIENTLADEHVLMGRRMAENQADLTLKLARETAMSAVLVFAHALVDDVALRCCRVIASLDRDAALKWLGRKKVVLGDVLPTRSDAEIDSMLLGMVEAFERESLPFKVDRIMEICGAVESVDWPKGFKFDSASLQTADRERHLTVHDQQLIQVGRDFHTPLLQLAEHLLVRVAMKYGIEIGAFRKR